MKSAIAQMGFVLALVLAAWRMGAAQPSISDFTLTLEPAADGARLACMKGCAWTTVTFGCGATQPCRAQVTQLGVGGVPFIESVPVRLSIRQGARTASFDVSASAPYDRGPSAGLPAMPLHPGTPASADGFRVRGWTEGGRTRVVVVALKQAGSVTGIETQIATFLLSTGESREVVETESVGAAHMIVGTEPIR